jgi:uncharacterized protein YjiS (DUF1127 family)
MSRAFTSLRAGRPNAAAPGDFGEIVKRAATAVYAWLRQCRARAAERHALARLTERDLRDIGISRSEAESEAEKSFWHR